MNQAILKFQQHAQDLGITDLSDAYATSAGNLLAELRQLKFPDGVVQLTYRSVITRLRQADANTFSLHGSLATHGAPTFYSSPTPLMGFVPITDVTDEVKMLVNQIFSHSVQIARAHAAGADRKSLEESLRQLALSHGMPEAVLESYLSGVPGANYGMVGSRQFGTSGTAFPMAEDHASPDADRFQRSDRKG